MTVLIVATIVVLPVVLTKKNLTTTKEGRFL
jgi:hypothetical protein